MYLIGFDSNFWLSSDTNYNYPLIRNFEEFDSISGYNLENLFKEKKEIFEKQNNENACRIVTVTFWGWNTNIEEYEYLVERRLLYGGCLNKEDYPILKEKEGYFVWWDDINISNIISNIDIYEKYDKYLTTLVSEDSYKPKVIAEGIFYSDSRLEITNIGESKNVSVIRRGEKIYYNDLKIKYYIGNLDGNIKLSILENNMVTDIDFEQDGDYIIFSINNNQCFIVTADNTDILSKIYPYIIGALVVLILTTFIAAIKKKRKVRTFR